MIIDIPDPEMKCFFRGFLEENNLFSQKDMNISAKRGEITLPTER